MVFQNDGLEMIGKVALRNESGNTPIKMIFTGSNNTYTGSEGAMVNEFIRKSITWTESGTHSKFTAHLASTDAVGSYIVGMGAVGSGTGSETLFFSEEVFIGDKTNTFNVQVIGDVYFRRPLQ